MNFIKKQKKWIYLGLLFLSILFVFFLSQKFNSKNGHKYWTLDVNGAQNFRKGLDVSGGTRLVYKISYEKYDQLYKGTELEHIKHNIENILFKKIDNRISSLGVADAKVYKQLMDGSTYIVVDIGGVSDLDQAKSIIGKTVELEFRLPSTDKSSPEMKKERETIALNLVKEISQHPDHFKDLSENKGSESIFYNHFTGASVDQLPIVLQNNITVLDSLMTGKVYDSLIGGIYTYTQTTTATGGVAYEPVQGYGIVRLNNRQKAENVDITPTDIVRLAKQDGLVFKQDQVLHSGAIEKNVIVKNGNYNWYHQVFSTGVMYNVKVVFTTFSGADASVVSGIVNTIKTGDTFPHATLLMGGWKSLEEIKATISSFDPDALEVGSVKVYDELNSKYIVYIENKKSPTDYLYDHVVVENIPEDFENALSKKVVYDIDFTFVQDKELWVLAKTLNGKILNGAYFKFANASVGQLGESVVEINFDDEGKQIFCDITAQHIGEQMAIFIAGKLMTNPIIRSKICGGVAQISGGYTPQTAKELSEALNDGALPAPLILLQEEKISPVLGENALNNAVIAGLVGIVAIFVFVLLMYGVKKALITLGVLLMFLLVLGLFMKITSYALSMSGIAAVILSLGMAVDANILIFERLKEERNHNKNISSAIEVAYDRSRSAIKDGNVSTGIIAFLLFTMGNSIFKGFGAMLIITVIVTLLINVPLTKILLQAFYKNDDNKDS